ncbi:Uncharacterised protein [Pseudomonas aeruginosa]|nr:Uncharacterised protein [Pseudomonas aeruginosa]
MGETFTRDPRHGFLHSCGALAPTPPAIPGGLPLYEVDMTASSDTTSSAAPAARPHALPAKPRRPPAVRRCRTASCKPPRKKWTPPPKPPPAPTRTTGNCRPAAARNSSIPSPPNSTRWTTISSPSSAVKPRYRPRASRANAAAPAASCACSPEVLRRGDFHGAPSTAPGPNASRCHASTCASAGSASARWRCSARATSPWRSPPPAAIPPRPWPPAARWCSRRTADTWPPPNGSPRRSSARPSAPACRRACST